MRLDPPGWAVGRSARALDVVAIMSDTKIDFTHAAMPGGAVDGTPARDHGFVQARRAAERARHQRDAFRDVERAEPG